MNEDEMSTAQSTALSPALRAQEDTALRHAMHRLLDKLRDWIRVYPVIESDKLPDHDVVWLASVTPEGGADRAILDAIRMHPELWAHAIPPECCVVPRAMLSKLIGDGAAEALASYGADAVARRACFHLHRQELNQPRGLSAVEAPTSADGVTKE